MIMKCQNLVILTHYPRYKLLLAKVMVIRFSKNVSFKPLLICLEVLNDNRSVSNLLFAVNAGIRMLTYFMTATSTPTVEVILQRLRF